MIPNVIPPNLQLADQDDPLPLDEARRVRWPFEGREPMGAMLDRGALTRDKLQWAAEQARWPEVKRAAWRLIEEQYDAILAEYAIGDWGEATIEPGEKRLTVRNRLSAAANRRQLGLAFRRTRPEQLRFQVVLPSVPAVLQVPALASVPDVQAESAPPPRRRGRTKAVAVALPAPEPAPAPKRRGGRPKKAV